jgi:DNA-binding response OmpR family regulator
MKQNRVLLAEGDILLATDLAFEFEMSEFTISALACTLPGALKGIEGSRPDLAVLNIELQGGNSYPAARRLKALGIPFVFITDLEEVEICLEFQDVPCRMKPQDCKDVAAFVAGLVENFNQRPALPAKAREKVTAI